MKIGIAIPSGDYWHPQMGMGFGKMLLHYRGTFPDNKVIIMSSTSSLIHDNRNRLWDLAKEHDVDYLLYLDSDMNFPPNVIEKLTDQEKDIIGACASTRKPPITVNCFPEEGNKRMPHEEARKKCEEGKTEKVFAIGAACIMVSRKVLETAEQPVFEYAVTPGHWQMSSEDYVFCHKMNRQGFEVWCDWSVSAKLQHWSGTACFEIGRVKF